MSNYDTTVPVRGADLEAKTTIVTADGARLYIEKVEHISILSGIGKETLSNTQMLITVYGGWDGDTPYLVDALDEFKILVG